MNIEALRAEETKLIKKYHEYNRGMNEAGEGYNPYEAQLSAITDQIIALQRQAENDEWTIEVTQKRREDWNAWVKNFGSSKIDALALSAHINEVGYGPEDLKRHIKRHEL